MESVDLIEKITIITSSDGLAPLEDNTESEEYSFQRSDIDEEVMALLEEDISGSNFENTKIEIVRRITIRINSPVKWKFIFFNLPILSCKLKKIESEINKIILDYGELGNVIKDKDGRDLIKELFRKYFGKKGINNTSICCYHGPIGKKEPFYLRSCKWDREIFYDILRCYPSLGCQTRLLYLPRRQSKFGTLLTGDIDLSNSNNYKSFSEYFRQEKSETGIIFFPHHGSVKNWNDDLLKEFGDTESLWIASVGLGNSYGHPHIGTIAKVLKGYNNLVFISNELEGISYTVH